MGTQQPTDCWPLTTVLFDLLGARAQLATHATPPVLRVVIDHASPALAAVVEGALPRYSTELLRPARDLAQHLLDTLPPDAPAAQRASRLNILGVRLSEVGDNRAALDPGPSTSAGGWPTPSPPPTCPTSPSA
jgi:hypothetical protein